MSIAVLSGGCASDQARPDEKALSDGSATRLYDPITGRELTELDFGEDWLTPASATGTDDGDRAADASAALPFHTAAIADPFWAVVLATYSGDNHQQAAATTAAQVQQLAPQLESVRVHTTDKGSIVISGRYESVDDERAKDGLAQVKRIGINDRRMFAKAMLTVITPEVPRGDRSPYSLWAARRSYPDVDPLYTLQIAVWSDFGSGELSMDVVRRRAEDMTAKLRQQGHQAFFHHHAARPLSVVTVGLFDRRAIDAQSGIPSSEVTGLLKQFPSHMVNGEPLQELIDTRRPDLGTQTQKPMLVEVPD